MSTKIVKKLVLNKETLRELTPSQLAKILGGIGPSDLPEDSCHSCNSCKC